MGEVPITKCKDLHFLCLFEFKSDVNVFFPFFFFSLFPFLSASQYPTKIYRNTFSFFRSIMRLSPILLTSQYYVNHVRPKNGRRPTRQPFPFQNILPISLRDHVSGKGNKQQSELFSILYVCVCPCSCSCSCSCLCPSHAQKE